MTTIKIESNDLTYEEADNLMECMLTHYGWATFVDKIFIGNKIVYDIKDKKDQHFIHSMLELRMKRHSRLREKKEDEVK